MVAARKVARLTHDYYDAHWLSPGPEGELCPGVPLFDVAPAASMDLLRECSECEITRFGPTVWGAKLTLMDNRVGDGMCQNTLEAAVADAWLKARGKSGG